MGPSAFRRQHISQIFTGSDVKLAFVSMGEKSVSADSAECFPDMGFVL